MWLLLLRGLLVVSLLAASAVSVVPALMTAVMIFDAPDSDADPLNWVCSATLLLFPLSCLTAAASASGLLPPLLLAAPILHGGFFWLVLEAKRRGEVVLAEVASIHAAQAPLR